MASHRGVVSRQGPQPTGSYPHAHVHDGLVWVTAQAGRDPDHHGELVPGGMAGQLDQAIDNLEAILADCGSALDRVVKTNVMYTDPDDADAIEAVYRRRFGPAGPPCTVWGVRFLASEPGTETVRVQIECLASTR